MRTFLSSLLVVAAAFAQSDMVRVKRGSHPIEFRDVQVTQDDVRGVKAKRGPANWSWPAIEVLDVVYGVQPTAFRAAQKQLADGAPRDAAKQFEATLAADAANPDYAWLRAYALRGLAQAREAAGDAAASAEAWADLVRTAPSSRLAPEARLHVVRLRVRTAKLDDAKAALDAARKAAVDETWPAVLMARLDLWGVRVSAARGDGSGAELLARRLAQSTETPADTAAEARVELGVVLLKRRDFAGAAQAFEACLKPEASAPVWAAALNGLGDVAFDEGRFDEAALRYSRVFAPAIRDASLREEVAWALFRAGKACDFKRRTLADDDPGRGTWAARSRQLLRRAAREFPGTRGGDLAAKE